jgi:hypothetical protein
MRRSRAASINGVRYFDRKYTNPLAPADVVSFVRTKHGLTGATGILAIAASSNERRTIKCGASGLQEDAITSFSLPAEIDD